MAPLSRRTYFPFYSIRVYTWLQWRSSFPDDGFSGLESHTVAGMVRRYRFVIEIYHHPHYLSFILYFFWGGGVSCTVRHDRFGTSHCSRRSCGVIDTSFRSSCSRFSVSWAQRSSLDSAFSGIFFLLSEWTCICSWGGGVRHPRPVRESSCPTWSFLPVAWFLSDWCFPFPLFRSGGLEIQFPRPLLILFIGRDVSGPLSQR